MTKQITVTKALTELKKTDKRINKLAGTTPFILTAENSRVPGYKTVEEASSVISSGLQAIEALIANRNELKAKITASNAATKVTIAGVEMTVAEAIERKESISLQEYILERMKQAYSATINKQVNHNRRVNQMVEDKINQVMGNVKKVESNDSTVKAIREQIESNNKLDIIDPTGLAEKIKELEESIENFRADVDVELSIINATTAIEVTLA